MKLRQKFVLRLLKQLDASSVGTTEIAASRSGLDTLVFQIDLWSARGELPRMPEDIAGIAAFLVSDEASYITGADFRVDGGQGPMSSAETFT